MHWLEFGQTPVARGRNVVVCSALLLGALNCSSAADPSQPCEPWSQIVTRSFNMANPSSDAPEQIANALSIDSPDFLSLQECQACQEILAAASSSYQVTREPISGVALAYDASRWALLTSEVLLLGDDDDGWGKRYAVYGRFSSLQSEHQVEQVSTHYCVNIRRNDDACTSQRQKEYSQLVVDTLRPSLDSEIPLIVGGDFNVFSEDSASQSPHPALLPFYEAGMLDIYREANALGEGLTFSGNSWAPAARIDYLWSSGPVEVIGAEIRELEGAFSDHLAVDATLGFSPPPGCE